jgi:hypothetical protein
MRLQFDTASVGEALPVADSLAMASHLMPAFKAALQAHPIVSGAVDWKNPGWTNIGATSTCAASDVLATKRGVATWACVDFPLNLLLTDASQVPNVLTLLSTPTEIDAHLHADFATAKTLLHLSPAYQMQRRMLGSLGITATEAAIIAATTATATTVTDHIVDCALSAWSAFPACSRSCGGHSEVHRSRSVVTAAAFGGKVCAATSDAKDCLSDAKCPIDCVLSDWKSWGACTEDCGTGTQSRVRTTTTSPRFGGKECGEVSHTRNCNVHPCAVHCDFFWNEWPSCSKTCGTGMQMRTTTVKKAAAHGGSECPPSEERVCSTGACPIDCVLTPWTAFGACSKSCNTGTKTKHRSIITEAAHGGTACTRLTVSTVCSDFKCATDCLQSDWSEWGGCDRSCGLGAAMRKRSVVTPALHGGKSCEHPTDARECKLAECPVHCAVSDWSSWGACSATCGTTGYHRQARSVITAAMYGGRTCPAEDAMQQIKACNTFACPVDCKVSAWSSWGDCSVKCGEGGLRDRTRTVSTRAGNNGVVCPALTEREACVGVRCPVDCDHDWAVWTACSVSCAGGVQSRAVLVKVAAAHGGNACPDDQERVCNTHACPTPYPTTYPTSSPTPPPTPAWSKPTVTIIGDDVVTLEVIPRMTASQLTSYHSRLLSGQGYSIDPGATCTDLVWGDLSGSVKISGAVDPTKVGEYTLRYGCTNPAPWSVSADLAARKVLVVDTQCPACTVQGDDEISVEASFPFKDKGAVCTDLGLPLPVSTIGSVDIDSRGVYVLTYRAKDVHGQYSDGASGCVGGKVYTRTVTVIDTLKPVIQLTASTSSLIREAEKIELAQSSATDTSKATDNMGMSNPAAGHYDSIIESLRKKLAALTESAYPRTAVAAAGDTATTHAVDAFLSSAGVEGVEVGAAPWLKPNPSDWVNPRNLQKSFADCRSMCMGMKGCRYGTFIGFGARKGECWLTGTKAETAAKCTAKCTSFEVEHGGRRLLRGAE